MQNIVLQVAAVVAAGVVSKPGSDLSDPDRIAKEIVTLAKALIREAEKN